MNDATLTPSQQHPDRDTIWTKIYYGILWSWYKFYIDVRQDGSGWNLPYKKRHCYEAP